MKSILYRLIFSKKQRTIIYHCLLTVGNENLREQLSIEKGEKEGDLEELEWFENVVNSVQKIIIKNKK